MHLWSDLEAEGLVLNGNRGSERRIKHPPLFTFHRLRVNVFIHSSNGVRPREMPHGIKTTSLAAKAEW